MNLQAIKRDVELEESKLFGEVYLPNAWLEDDCFSPFEFFVAQINLAEITSEYLPSKGYLYFFIEAYSFTKNKMKARVRYSAEEPDAYTDFNDGFFDVDPEECALLKNSLGLLNFIEDCGEQIALLTIPSQYLPEEIECEKLSFLINLIDLKELRFDNCSLVFIN
jgi:hypothetical protein